MSPQAVEAETNPDTTKVVRAANNHPAPPPNILNVDATRRSLSSLVRFVTIAFNAAAIPL